jgi:hypothetical protein
MSAPIMVELITDTVKVTRNNRPFINKLSLTTLVSVNIDAPVIDRHNDEVEPNMHLSTVASNAVAAIGVNINIAALLSPAVLEFVNKHFMNFRYREVANITPPFVDVAWLQSK